MTDFSYQLYSSRNFGPLAETVRMVARLGYAQVEGYGAVFADEATVAELRAALEGSGVTMPTAHFGLDVLENEPGRVLRLATDLGLRAVYCPFVQPGERPETGAEYEAFGARLEEAGKPFRDAGLGFGWHNHDFEFRALADGTVPMGAIFAGGPGLEWEADIAWVIKGGADPLRWIADYGERISAVHVKDIAPEGDALDEGGWADVGHGVVDWPGLMRALRGTRARYFVMEHDNPSDDARFAERSIAAARSY